jgi:hypothetical protein
MQTSNGNAGRPSSADIAYGRSPLAPEADRLRATARWNVKAAAEARRKRRHADEVRYRLNATKCDTRRAELLAMREPLRSAA